MAPHSPIIHVMVKAVRKASRGLLRDFGEVEQLQVSLKGPADFVSHADLKAEATLREELSRVRPGFGFLMEESGEIRGDGRNRWIVDPLDGTLNFLHGIPHFSLSVAHEYDGKIVAGLVFDPIRNEMFTAEEGKGAFLNNKRLRVSARRNLDEAIFATGIPCLGRKCSPAYRGMLEAVMENCAGLRQLGSAALDLAYVAAGRYEAFWEAGLQLWDIAAGTLILHEAGGMICDFECKQSFLRSGDIVASNENLRDSAVKLLLSNTRY